jgi:hypothetical protein
VEEDRGFVAAYVVLLFVGMVGFVLGLFVGLWNW